MHLKHIDRPAVLAALLLSLTIGPADSEVRLSGTEDHIVLRANGAPVRVAFFAPGNDPTVWRGGWYPAAAKMEFAARRFADAASHRRSPYAGTDSCAVSTEARYCWRASGIFTTSFRSKRGTLEVTARVLNRP